MKATQPREKEKELQGFKPKKEQKKNQITAQMESPDPKGKPGSEVGDNQTLMMI